jgi:hypothetical protein
MRRLAEYKVDANGPGASADPKPIACGGGPQGWTRPRFETLLRNTRFAALARKGVQTDQSEMLVLMSLMFVCLQRLFDALFPGMRRLNAPHPRALTAAQQAARSQQLSLAPIHAPTPRLIL